VSEKSLALQSKALIIAAIGSPISFDTKSSGDPISYTIYSSSLAELNIILGFITELIYMKLVISNIINLDSSISKEFPM